jgi:hypothetical protein
VWTSVRRRCERDENLWERVRLFKSRGKPIVTTLEREWWLRSNKIPPPSKITWWEYGRHSFITSALALLVGGSQLDEAQPILHLYVKHGAMWHRYSLQRLRRTHAIYMQEYPRSFARSWYLSALLAARHCVACRAFRPRGTAGKYSHCVSPWQTEVFSVRNHTNLTARNINNL